MENLESDELFHMAMHATKQGRADDAIAPLKKFLVAKPDSAEAHFLLAANYAEIGLLDRSVTHYNIALELAPEMDVATIQFALLLIAIDRTNEASNVISAIVNRGQADYMSHFAHGLQYLIDEDMANAEVRIRKGIAANQDNVDLNVNMQKIADQIGGVEEASDANSTEFLLSAYGKKH